MGGVSLAVAVAVFSGRRRGRGLPKTTTPAPSEAGPGVRRERSRTSRVRHHGRWPERSGARVRDPRPPAGPPDAPPRHRREHRQPAACDQPAIERLGGDVDGGGHLARRARHAAFGHQRNLVAAVYAAQQGLASARAVPACPFALGPLKAHRPRSRSAVQMLVMTPFSPIKPDPSTTATGASITRRCARRRDLHHTAHPQIPLSLTSPAPALKDRPTGRRIFVVESVGPWAPRPANGAHPQRGLPARNCPGPARPRSCVIGATAPPRADRDLCRRAPPRRGNGSRRLPDRWDMTRAIQGVAAEISAKSGRGRG